MRSELSITFLTFQAQTSSQHHDDDQDDEQDDDDVDVDDVLSRDNSPSGKLSFKQFLRK